STRYNPPWSAPSPNCDASRTSWENRSATDAPPAGPRSPHRSPRDAEERGDPVSLSCTPPVWCGATVPDVQTLAPHLEFDDVCMAFGERRVFDHLSFRFPAGRISVILGGSG